MATYQFRIDDGSLERHDLQLPNDDAAVREALRTVADLVREEPMQGAGDVTRRLEVRATRGDTILKVSIHLSRER